MSDAEWVSRCADRLQEQWPRAQRDALEETARELMQQGRWRECAGEEAAVRWLRLGVLVH